MTDYTAEDVFNAIYGGESGYGRDPRTSPQGAVGPMQIMPATFKQWAKPGESITNPDDNRAVAMRMIRSYMNQYGNDPARVAVAYFPAPGNVAPPGSPTPYVRNAPDVNEPTSAYVANVEKRLGKYGGGGTAAFPVPTTTKYGGGGAAAFPLPSTDAPAVATTPPGTTLTTSAAPPKPGSILPGFGTSQASQNFTEGLTKLNTAMGGQAPGAGGDQRPQQATESPMIPGPGSRNTSPGGGALLPASPQISQAITGYQPNIYGTTLSGLNPSMQWNSDPQAAPPQAQPIGAQAAPSTPMGTSLASLQQLYALMQQSGQDFGGYG